MHWRFDVCIVDVVDAPDCIGAPQTAGALRAVVRASNDGRGPCLGI